MFKILVNDPTGAQLLLEIDKTGQYFDQSRVLWDTRKDGKLPSDFEPGKMMRDNKILRKLDDFIPEHKNFLERKSQEEQKEQEIKEKKDQLSESILNDNIMKELSNLSASEVDEWFKLNGKAKSNEIINLIIKLMIKNGLFK